MSELRGNLSEKMIPTPSARLNSPAVKATTYLSLPATDRLNGEDNGVLCGLSGKGEETRIIRKVGHLVTIDNG